MTDTPEPAGRSFLEQISTRWTSVNDPLQFVLRYAPAVRGYLGALIPNVHDAEEVAQEFLMQSVRQGFRHADPGKGRFRDYLKAAVRHAAFKHFRRQRGTAPLTEMTEPADNSADLAWLRDWQRCVLDRAWHALDRHERAHPDGLAHTALRLAVEHPDEDSPTLAALASQKSGRTIRADAFRKQLSRARRLFAECLINEVKATLENPSPERVEEELAALGLLALIQKTRTRDGS